MNAPLTYTLIITNNGPATAKNIQATVSLPDNVVYSEARADSVSLSSDDALNTVTLSTAYLTPNSYVLVNLLVKSTALGTHASKILVGPPPQAQPPSFSVRDGVADPVATNNVCLLPPVNVVTTESIPSVPGTLVVSGRSLAPSVHVNDSFSYAVQVTNTGQTALTNLKVSVPLPPNVQYESGSSGIQVIHNADTNTDTLTFVEPSLPVAGVFASFFFVHATAVGTVPPIVATATSGTTTRGTFTIPAVIVTAAPVIPPGPDLLVTIVGPTTPVVVGVTFTYTVVVKNVGNAPAQLLQLKSLSYKPVGSPQDSDGLRLDLRSPLIHSQNLQSTLYPGGSASLIYPVIAIRPSSIGSPVTASAIATCASPQVILNADNTESIPIVAVEPSDLGVKVSTVTFINHKFNYNPGFQVGSVEYYLIDVTNKSRVPFKYDAETKTGGVILQDMIPAGMDILSGTKLRIGDGSERSVQGGAIPDSPSRSGRGQSGNTPRNRSRPERQNRWSGPLTSLGCDGLHEKPITLRVCLRQLATTVNIRSTNRLPRSPSVP